MIVRSSNLASQLEEREKTEREERFKHILAPIRALTDVWNIDVAKELEEYLLEIEELSFRFADGPSTLNFVQAASAISNSTDVYSRKVEYLHALVYQCLDQISKQRKEKARRGGDGGEDGAVVPEINVDAIKEGSNIDMGPDEGVPDGARRQSLLVMRTPTSLLRRDQAQVYLYDHKGAKISNKQDFKMNTFVFHHTGAMVDPGEALKIDAAFRTAPSGQAASRLHMFGHNPRANLYLQPMATAVPRWIPEQPQQPAAESEMGDGPMEFGGDDDADDDGGFEAPDNQPMELAPSEHAPMAADQAQPDWLSPRDPSPMDETATQRTTRSAISRATATSTPAAPWDPWAPADAHECSRPAKPFRKGKTYRIPPALKDTAKASKQRPPAESLTEFYSRLDREKEVKGLPKNEIKGPTYPEFARLFLREYRRRKEIARAERAAYLDLRRALGEDIASTVYSETHFDQLESAAPDSDTDMPNDPMDEDDDAEAPDFGPMDLAASASVAGGAQTFEDLVRQHIDQYMSSASQYVQQSDLSNRVRAWEDRIKPILDEEETHGPYDIQHYGREILHKGFDENTEAMPFEALATDRPAYEVCRMFLAVLQLANSGNVDIQQEKVTGPTKDNRMVVRLLARGPLHSLDGLANITAH
eukprot:comp23502_c0_seq1/m.39368 comp23502_c0_seq1/g.39368  ORF comp23502_c0_seq1/g.39368 comp23502_c0_seq1/m.39368 type:complete len:646 (-) comp23502_c0_seq1:376-2313(-)